VTSRTLPLSLIAVSALLFATAASAPATAAGAPTDTRTSITVNCLLGEGSNDNQIILPGDTLTVTLLNCDAWTVEDLDVSGTLEDPAGGLSDSWIVVGTPADFEVNGSSNILLTEPDDLLPEIDIDVRVASAAPTPTGSLGLTTRVAMPVVIPTFEINVPADPYLGAPGPTTDLGGLSDCSIEDGYHPYQALPISISTAGDFTFRVIDVTPVDEDLQWGQPYVPSQDFFLAVYTQFDPANPEANLVNCNDDRNENRIFVINDGVTFISDDQTPEFAAALEPGDYTLVLTTYRTSSSSEWAAGEFSSWSGVSDFSWDPQPMSGLFELWGPVGSIAANDDQATAPELAATGEDTTVSAGIAGLGLLTALAGGALLLGRRRATRRS